MTSSPPGPALSGAGTSLGWGPDLGLWPGNPGPQDRSGLSSGDLMLSQDCHCDNQHGDNDCPSCHTTPWVWSPMVTKCHTTIPAESLSPLVCPCVPAPPPLFPCPVSAPIPVSPCPHPCGPVSPQARAPLSPCPCVPDPVSLFPYPCVPHVPVSLALCAQPCAPVPLSLCAHPCAPLPVSASLSHVPAPASPCPRVRSLCAYPRVPGPAPPCPPVPTPLSLCPRPVSVSPISRVPVSPCPCSCVLGPAPRAACPVLSREVPVQGLRGLWRVEARTRHKDLQLLPPGWQLLLRLVLLPRPPPSPGSNTNTPTAGLPCSPSKPSGQRLHAWGGTGRPRQVHSDSL
ncbi:uncharacterized protein LOC131813079 [Mustela lutreola]|uniref:uncharacterized protein LOC131813079 n=1 Tax=Mustela lutreola TaxID=9666 RepID=UPI0027975E56|nr:uncharacterized protein LOC131813079 [Mustela lutreola]XP_058999225.1 uncharacterized protein LOC131813079 [Mustela lutreola]XP_058999226.1 uncharacterized protein LOC131813079 [Mustela lutreola]